MAEGRSDRDFQKFMSDMKSKVDELLNTLEAMVQSNQGRSIITNEENMMRVLRTLITLFEDHYGRMDNLQLSEPQLAKYHQQVSQQMAQRSNLLESLSKICVEIFKVQADSSFNTSRETVDKLHAKLLLVIGATFHNLTDSSLEFCLALSRIKFLFKDFAKPMLSKWFHKHEVNDGCYRAVKSCLGFIYNMFFRSNPVVHRALSELKVVEPVGPYLKSSNLHVQTFALLIIAFALDESNANMYETSRDAMEYLVSCLSESLESESRTACGYHVSELTVCINRLALNDVNKRLFVKLELLPVLHRMCTGYRDEDVVAALDILFTLSQLADNRLPIEQQFLDILVKLFAKSEPISEAGGLLRNYRSMQGLDRHLDGRVSAKISGTKEIQQTPERKQQELAGVAEEFKKLQVAKVNPLRFHQRTGSNIRLSTDRLTAMRQNSHRCHNEALALSERPLEVGESLTFKIDFWDEDSSYCGSFSFGVTDKNLAQMKTLPSCFDEISNVWGVWFENTVIVGNPGPQSIGIDLKARSGDTVGLQVSPTSGELLLFFNGRRIFLEEESPVLPLSSPLWAVVDVYGPCCQVSIVPNEIQAKSETEVVAVPRTEAHLQTPPNEVNEVDATFETWDFVRENDKKKSIGSGGFGKVFQAFTNRHQFVAVKVIKPLMQTTPEAQRKIFEQEKRALELLSKVRHANVVRFLKAEESAGKYFIFCELLSGCTIYELMERQGQPIAEDGIRKFIGQTCLALSHLHGLTNPIIHRDIKSSNLMLTYSGTVKLIDFGFAREIATSQMVTHNQCGTLHFMAPEILTAEDEVVYTPKTDMWALGCTVFEMATASPPNDEVRQLFRLAMLISSKPMPQPPQSASSSLREFYQWCVQQQPGDRPTASDAMKHRFLAG